jgi:hypothetical protein
MTRKARKPINLEQFVASIVGFPPWFAFHGVGSGGSQATFVFSEVTFSASNALRHEKSVSWRQKPNSLGRFTMAMASRCNSSRVHVRVLTIGLLGVFLRLSSVVEPSIRAEQADAGEARVTYLSQGWSDDERHTFYYMTQGSHLIPYEWFLHLEMREGEELFRNDSHMDRLRFIPQAKKTQRNPDGLPIGFVIDDNPTTVNDGSEYRLKQAFLDSEYTIEDFPRTNRWLGLTCAACHTADIHHAGEIIRIDGGSSMADVEQFLVQLAAAVEATWRDNGKLTRFARRVLSDTGYDEVEQEALKVEVETYSRVLNQVVRRSRGTSPYGFARLDAFGAILNEICEVALEEPDNHFPADAPASYPFLWDTSRLDWVQWNGSAGNPMARNVGEVLGVFGRLRLRPEPSQDQFRSSVRIDYLYELEQRVAQLKAPSWSEAFGDLDGDLVAKGRVLYEQNCQSCHFLPDATTGNYPEITIGRDSFIRTRMIPVDRIGTDPQLADNFLTRLARPGILAAQLPAEYAGLERIPRPVLLGLAVGGVIRRNVQVRGLSQDQIAALGAYRPAGEQPPDLWGYKARPLNGIWATAPYLHNGSVPTLYDLLLPDYERPTTFHVGSREFDPRRVGFRTDPEPETFRFRVHDERGRVIPGNSNAGHSGRNFTHRRAVDGTLREFTEDERWALVEFLKSL